MKMAKASEKDMEAAAVIAGILTDLDSGYFPRLPDPDAEPDENEPTFFDEDDEEHQRILHDRLKAALDLAPGCLGRVIGGFHTLMHNDIVDPDEDCLALHPRIVAALATAEEAKPVPEDQQEKRVYEALTIQALHIRNEVFRGAGMGRKEFDSVYLGGIGTFERDLAAREGIEIKP